MYINLNGSIFQLTRCFEGTFSIFLTWINDFPAIHVEAGMVNKILHILYISRIKLRNGFCFLSLRKILMSWRDRWSFLIDHMYRKNFVCRKTIFYGQHAWHQSCRPWHIVKYCIYNTVFSFLSYFSAQKYNWLFLQNMVKRRLIFHLNDSTSYTEKWENELLFYIKSAVRKYLQLMYKMHQLPVEPVVYSPVHFFFLFYINKKYIPNELELIFYLFLRQKENK